MRVIINAVSARAGGGVAYLVKLLGLLPEIAPDMQFLAVVPDIDFLKGISEKNNLQIKVVSEASGDLFRRFYYENTGLIELCHSWKADLLFCVANIAPIVNPGIPVVLMVQNVAPLTPGVARMYWKFEPAFQSLRMLFLKWLSLASISRSSRVIALSEATSSLLRRHNPRVHSEVLYHGISDEFNPMASRPERSGNTPYFIYVSNLYVYKGLEYIVDALADDPELPRVLIVGKPYDAGYVSWVRQRAESAGVADRIEFMDGVPRQHLPGWYAHAIAMVYTSWCENCPNILLESMACGCPVVAMNTGPMPEICGQTGFFAEPFSGKSLAKAMRSALNAESHVRRDAVARAAEFSWEKAMQRHRQIFLQFVK